MGLIVSDALNIAVSSVSPGEPLCLNNRVFTMTSLSLSPDLETKQHASGEQDPAGYHVPHGTQGVHQLCWLHQNRHSIAG